MIKAIIIEDEVTGRKSLENLLAAYCPQVKVVAAEATVPEGVKAIKTHLPDLLFLDIRLHTATEGFDLLEQTEGFHFELIFVTAFEEYAIRAINEDRRTCQYLCKPVNIVALKAAVKRVEENLLQKSWGEYIRHHATIHAHRISIPVKDGYLVVPETDIVRLEAQTSYVELHLWLEPKPKVISHHLKWYEDDFLQKKILHFIRVHKSHIVNLSFVTEFHHVSKGGFVVLKNQAKVPVSETYKATLLERLRDGFT